MANLECFYLTASSSLGRLGPALVEEKPLNWTITEVDNTANMAA